MGNGRGVGLLPFRCFIEWIEHREKGMISGGRNDILVCRV